jgi:hypothetical protein
MFGTIRKRITTIPQDFPNAFSLTLEVKLSGWLLAPATKFEY